MEETIYFIDHQRLLEEVGISNSDPNKWRRYYLKDGSLHTLQILCQLYGKLLDKESRRNPINQEHPPELYMNASEIGRKSGYHPRTIKEHLWVIESTDIISAKNIYQATYKIMFPLKFYFKASHVTYLG